MDLYIFTMAQLSDLPASSLRVREEANVLGRLFDLLGTSYLFVKDTQHRFVRCNRAMWSQLGLESEDEMIGKMDRDFYPPSLADAYVEEDRRVMASRKPIVDAIWLVPTQASLHWYRCSKLPVLDSSKDEVIGLAGILRPYEGEGRVPPEYERVKPALALAHRGFREGVSVKSLAQACG